MTPRTSHQISPRATKPGSGCVIVDGITARRIAAQWSETPKARSPSPASKDEAFNALNDNSRHDDVGPETQALLDANRAMLTGSTSPLATTCLPEGNRQREPDTTELPVTPGPTMAKPIDADVKLALVSVACGCRFLLDEVMEEYEELNRNLDATRSYFKEIRALINETKRRRGNNDSSS